MFATHRRILILAGMRTHLLAEGDSGCWVDTLDELIRIELKHYYDGFIPSR